MNVQLVVVVTITFVTAAARMEVGDAIHASKRFAKIVKKMISFLVTDAVILLVLCVWIATLVNMRAAMP